ncbi:MAG: hypothetical protein ABJE47_04830 [bacterium]
MNDLAVTDFVSFDDFPLRWRFADARRARLPAEALARVRPLSPAQAVIVAGVARSRCQDGRVFDVTFRSDDAPPDVTARLRALPLSPSTAILVSWNGRTAVASDWDVFVTHWEDFCYPASDDVTVWSIDAGWTLCYRHYECFQFNSGLPADSRATGPS